MGHFKSAFSWTVLGIVAIALLAISTIVAETWTALILIFTGGAKFVVLFSSVFQVMLLLSGLRTLSHSVQGTLSLPRISCLERRFVFWPSRKSSVWNYLNNTSFNIYATKTTRLGIPMYSQSGGFFFSKWLNQEKYLCQLKLDSTVHWLCPRASS